MQRWQAWQSLAWARIERDVRPVVPTIRAIDTFATMSTRKSFSLISKDATVLESGSILPDYQMDKRPGDRRG